MALSHLMTDAASPVADLYQSCSTCETLRQAESRQPSLSWRYAQNLQGHKGAATERHAPPRDFGRRISR